MKQSTLTPSGKCVCVIVALLAIMVVPVYFYGIRPVIIAAIAVVTAIVLEIIVKKLFFNLPKIGKHDYSSVVTALIIAMLMPASVSYYIVIVAVVGGLVIAKYAFGGSGRNIFNPAALGVAIVGISFPEQVLRFPTPGTMLPLAPVLSEKDGIIYATSPAAILNVGGTPQTDRFSVLLGNYAGAMGATCVIVLLAAALFLCVRRVVSYRIVIASIVTIAVFACLFPRLSTGRVNSMIFELTSGVVLFSIIFMASDPYTSPITSIGQWLYGFFLALVTMIFRTVGALDIEIVFVLLFMNALAGEFDRFAGFVRRKLSAKERQRLLNRRAEIAGKAGGRRV